MRILKTLDGKEYEFSNSCQCSKCIQAKELIEKLNEDDEEYEIVQSSDGEDDNSGDDDDDDNDNDSDEESDYDENGNFRLKHETSFNFMVKQLGKEHITKLSDKKVKPVFASKPLLSSKAKIAPEPPVYPKWTPKELEK